MPAIQCPNPACGKSFDISEDHLGRMGRCKQCGSRFTLSQSGEQSHSIRSRSTSDPSSKSDIPERLGRFEIRTRLGAGAFGTVYRAFDPVLNREIALKVPQSGTLQSPKAVERFLREAQAAAQLRHPHIVPIFDAGSDGPHHYIASAFIDGQTLAEVIDANEKGLDPREAARIVIALAEALHYAHGRGIIHRDVKPANVMIDAEGQPQLMDFGLARFELSEEKLTQDGAILGTPAYMAPEQAQNGRAAGPASDQYSLGVVIYELLCGQTPFSGPPAILLYNALNNSPPPLREANPAIPRDMETICLKALAKVPAERYGSEQDLADDLSLWLQDEPIMARRMSPLEKGVRLARRNPVATGLAGVCVVTLLLATIISLSYAGLARVWANAAAKHLKTAQEQTLLANTKTSEAQANLAESRRNELLLQKEKARFVAKAAEAIASATEARNEKGRADAKTEEALTIAKEERRQTDRSKRFFYILNWRAVIEALKEDELDRALPFLANIEAATQRSGDLRGCEWYLYQKHIQWNKARSWDLGTISGSLALTGHVGDVNDVSFSKNGLRLASVGVDKTLRVWDTDAGKAIYKVKLPAEASRVVFSPDCNRIATSSSINHQVWISDSISGAILFTLSYSFMGNDPTAFDLAFSADGTCLIGIGNGPTMNAWDVQTGISVVASLFPDYHPGAGYSTWGRGIVCQSGLRIAISSNREKAVIQSVLQDKSHIPLVSPSAEREFESMAFSHQGNRLASSKDGLRVRIWDTSSGTLISSVNQKEVIQRIEFTPDGHRLLTSTGKSTIDVWDTETGQHLLKFNNSKSDVTCIEFSQNGRRLAVGGGGRIRIWETSSPDIELEDSVKRVNDER